MRDAPSPSHRRRASSRQPVGKSLTPPSHRMHAYNRFPRTGDNRLQRKSLKRLDRAGGTRKPNPHVYPVPTAVLTHRTIRDGTTFATNWRSFIPFLRWAGTSYSPYGQATSALSLRMNASSYDSALKWPTSLIRTNSRFELTWKTGSPSLPTSNGFPRPTWLSFCTGRSWSPLRLLNRRPDKHSYPRWSIPYTVLSQQHAEYANFP
jgi:hypothetical protein